uniref:Uncharacterized protein n=1 Tax=Pyxicephalus adspersus TaxID=30357 RepID=A0AAV3A055_PYXAD|nr:TPA: hypothetical protein GDO54_015125 [Pyxicephalus adspersus]
MQMAILLCSDSTAVPGKGTRRPVGLSFEVSNYKMIIYQRGAQKWLFLAMVSSIKLTPHITDQSPSDLPQALKSAHTPIPHICSLAVPSV